MKKRGIFFAIVTCVLFVGYFYHVKKANVIHPSRIEEVERSLPYTIEKEGTKLTIYDYSFTSKFYEKMEYSEVKLFVTIETGDVVPTHPENLFSLDVYSDYRIASDIQEYSDNISGEDGRIVLEPNQTVEGYIVFHLWKENIRNWTDPAILITPGAFPEKYNEKWESGVIYFEYIPLEVEHAAS